jgi:hypothetical protein
MNPIIRLLLAKTLSWLSDAISIFEEPQSKQQNGWNCRSFWVGIQIKNALFEGANY